MLIIEFTSDSTIVFVMYTKLVNTRDDELYYSDQCHIRDGDFIGFFSSRDNWGLFHPQRANSNRQ